MGDGEVLSWIPNYKRILGGEYEISFNFVTN